MVVYVHLETNSSAVSWALFALASDLKIQDILRKELKKKITGDAPSLEDISSIVYLDYVVNETLRLYTPAALLMREATQAFTFKQYSFPKGTVFALPIQGKQMDPELFEDPETFKPERWATMNVSDDPYKYMPFWTGIRGCIGKSMAIMEFKTILAMLVTNFEFKLNKDAPPVERLLKVTQRPSHLILDIKVVE